MTIIYNVFAYVLERHLKTCPTPRKVSTTSALEFVTFIDTSRQVIILTYQLLPCEARYQVYIFRRICHTEDFNVSQTSIHIHVKSCDTTKTGYLSHTVLIVCSTYHCVLALRIAIMSRSVHHLILIAQFSLLHLPCYQ